MIDEKRLSELRALAEKATPGPWKQTEIGASLKRFVSRYSQMMGELVIIDCRGTAIQSEELAAYVAAFNPETASALLDEVDRLQRTVDRKDEQMGELQGEVERLRSTAREWEVKCDNRVAAMELAQAEVERLKRETQKAYERMETVIRETTRIVDEANAPAARLALLEGTVEDLAKASMVIVRKLGVDGFTTVGSIWDEDMHEAVNAVRRVVSAVTPDKP